MTVYYSSMTQKLDNASTDGLNGVIDSVAYRIHEVESHFHSWESWFEIAASPSETHFADRIGTGGGPFQIDAGNDTWGSWVQILGSADTPARAGALRFDLHRLSIASTERTSTYFLQFAIGASGAAGLAADTYTDFSYTPISSKDANPVEVQMNRCLAGNLVWVRGMCPGFDTGTLDFYVGLHEYTG